MITIICVTFFKYICNFLDQLLHLYKFYGWDMSGKLFFIFASCEPLMFYFLIMSILLMKINQQKDIFYSYDFSVYTASKYRNIKLDTYRRITFLFTIVFISKLWWNYI